MKYSRAVTCILYSALLLLSAVACNDSTEPKVEVPKPGDSEAALRTVVSKMGGRAFPEDDRPGTFFVNLSGATIDRKNLEELCQFQGIVELSLSGTNIDDNLLLSVVKLQKLHRVNLSETSVSSGGVDQLAGLPLLRELNIASTKINREDFKCVLKLSALKVLVVSDSQTTLSALRVIEHHKSLQNVYMEHDGGSYNVWMRGGLSENMKQYWRDE